MHLLLNLPVFCAILIFLNTSEKMFPPVSKGRTAVARVQPNQKPTVAVAPSSNVPRAGRIAGRGAGSADRARGPTVRKK